MRTAQSKYRLVSLREKHLVAYADLLHEVLTELHGDNPEALDAFVKQYSIQFLLQAISTPTMYCPLILDEAGKCVGVGFCRHDGELGRVNWICVRADLRKRGVGSKLLNSMITYFANRGCKRVDLATYLGNNELRSWYENREFQVASTMPNFRFGIDLWQMVRELAPLATQPIFQEHEKITMQGGGY